MVQARTARCTEKSRHDAEVYYKIRQYDLQRDTRSLKHWMARLSSPHARKNTRRLLRHASFPFALDKLLSSPGLRSGLRISTVHKMLDMRCDEEVLTYLEHIRAVWEKILCGNTTAIQKVDEVTVQALELKCPKYSTLHAEQIRSQLEGGSIFGGFTSQERMLIGDELMKIDCLIPSVFTLFEDIKFFEACARCMGHLTEVTEVRGEYLTFHTALRRDFSTENLKGNPYMIEVAPETFYQNLVPSENHFNLGVRQLWLFAMRSFRQMDPGPRKNKTRGLLAKVGSEEADEKILSEFASLAYRLGFRSEKIDNLRRRSSDGEIARKALLKARKPDFYVYSDETLQSHVSGIENMCASASRLPIRQHIPDFVSDDLDSPEPCCGFPDGEAYEKDKSMLFMQNIHRDFTGSGKVITSFFVRRSVYFAFLGKAAGNLTFPMPLNDEVQRLTSKFNQAAQEQLREQTQRETEERIKEQEEMARKARANARARQENAVQSEEGEQKARKRSLEKTDQILILFKARRGKNWETIHREVVHPSNPSKVEMAAKKFMRDDGMQPFSTDTIPLTPENCFEAAVSSGTNIIVLLRDGDINITEDLSRSISEIRP